MGQISSMERWPRYFVKRNYFEGRKASIPRGHSDCERVVYANRATPPPREMESRWRDALTLWEFGERKSSRQDELREPDIFRLL